MKSIFAVLLGFAVASDPAQSGQDQSPKKSTSEKISACPDARAWTGKYQNYSYGFSIVIPQGLRGFWNSAGCIENSDGCTCMSDHGRIIPLGSEPREDEPERHIEAYAGYAAHIYPVVLSEAVKSHLDRIRERSRDKSMKIRKRVRVTVAGLNGQRFVVRYFAVKSQTWMVEDFIELLRGDVEYDLYLRTPEGNYEHDQSVFDNVIASFRLTKRAQ
jgi:hypothetical protein